MAQVGCSPFSAHEILQMYMYFLEWDELINQHPCLSCAQGLKISFSKMNFTLLIKMSYFTRKVLWILFVVVLIMQFQLLQLDAFDSLRFPSAKLSISSVALLSMSFPSPFDAVEN